MFFGPAAPAARRRAQIQRRPQQTSDFLIALVWDKAKPYRAMTYRPRRQSNRGAAYRRRTATLLREIRPELAAIRLAMHQHLCTATAGAGINEPGGHDVAMEGPRPRCFSPPLFFDPAEVEAAMMRGNAEVVPHRGAGGILKGLERPSLDRAGSTNLPVAANDFIP